MKRILEFINQLIKNDREAVKTAVSLLMGGTQEEKNMAKAIMALVAANHHQMVNAFVSHFLEINKENEDGVSAFITICETLGVPEKNCIALLKLKGISSDDLESSEDDDSSSIDEIMENVKNMLFNKN
jgi:hypothetical protein